MKNYNSKIEMTRTVIPNAHRVIPNAHRVIPNAHRVIPNLFRDLVVKMLKPSFVQDYGRAQRVQHDKKILIYLLFFLSLLTFNLGHVSAQAILPLQVSPARQEIELDPMGKGAVNVKFFNLTDSPLSGTIKVADFTVTDKDGTPRIIDNTSQASPRFSGSAWVKTNYDRVTIPANDVLTVQARINVPENVRPGGRYIAVYFEPELTVGRPIGQTVKEGALGISPRIASLVFVRVKGQVTEQAVASRFFATTFQEYGPVTVTTEILNRGDYHIRPRGVITMANMFDGLVDQSKLEEINIFPDASREYTNKVGTKWMFGRYKINLVASYGDTGKAIAQSMYVYVMPWKVITVILIALILIILMSRHFYQNLIARQHILGERIEKESSEIERLKEKLRGRDE
ncbi:hypothetical protein A2690_01235 [Candidatus Roizmanbacteria bacterium RIFCSPHIGHO2_01_FULL_39_12b]|uniref:DUF916 domain-containing protein n=1 Tax=Candidatus Roizmanbacteria bacterium RIFCSPHIGHO2_01_FULL_39_12b TaxID=1802030 RepID=A0A1F7G9K9_9BACT|nr:MAG: hypothetical protein A2690_01235 [Candidatus Roizmanbacteria bacterium RIFCSPHIGHO2_01_FULL_39_12b]OGK45987.1 MAG: hypothetical protein A3B46_00995 [Candidatus Roizmanbacteria bacterium RIFCSPLOWO2_01_FULL_39_19]